MRVASTVHPFCQRPQFCQLFSGPLLDTDHPDSPLEASPKSNQIKSSSSSSSSSSSWLKATAFLAFHASFPRPAAVWSQRKPEVQSYCIADSGQFHGLGAGTRGASSPSGHHCQGIRSATSFLGIVLNLALLVFLRCHWGVDGIWGSTKQVWATDLIRALVAGEATGSPHVRS